MLAVRASRTKLRESQTMRAEHAQVTMPHHASVRAKLRTMRTACPTMPRMQAEGYPGGLPDRAVM